MDAINEFFKNLATKLKLPDFFKGNTFVLNNLFLALIVLVLVIALILVIVLVPSKKKSKKGEGSAPASDEEVPEESASEEAIAEETAEEETPAEEAAEEPAEEVVAVEEEPAEEAAPAEEAVEETPVEEEVPAEEEVTEVPAEEEVTEEPAEEEAAAEEPEEAVAEAEEPEEIKEEEPEAIEVEDEPAEEEVAEEEITAAAEETEEEPAEEIAVEDEPAEESPVEEPVEEAAEEVSVEEEAAVEEAPAEEEEAQEEVAAAEEAEEESAAPKKEKKAAPKAAKKPAKAEEPAPKAAIATKQKEVKLKNPTEGKTLGKYEILERNGSHYFLLKANNGQLLAESPSYTTEAGAKKAIDTFKNAVINGEWTIDEEKNGMFRFILRASSRSQMRYYGESYSTRQSAEKSIQSVRNFAQNAIIKVVENTDGSATAANDSATVFVPDPITESSYKNGGKYEIVEQNPGNFHFVLKANNGQLLLESPSYTSEQGAKSGIETFKKAVETGIYTIDEDKNGNFKFILRASTRSQIRYFGESYATRQRAESSVNSVRSFAAKAVLKKSE